MANTDTPIRKARPRLPKTVSTVVRAARDKQAFDIVVLDLRKAGGFTDYFVICTGQNPRQIAAITDAVMTAVREGAGDKPALVEGVQKSEWVLIDYFNVVVHVFSRECRAFYGLERLWGNAVRHDIPDE
jgi:ribosome-associated protein